MLITVLFLFYFVHGIQALMKPNRYLKLHLQKIATDRFLSNLDSCPWNQYIY